MSAKQQDHRKGRPGKLAAPAKSAADTKVVEPTAVAKPTEAVGSAKSLIAEQKDLMEAITKFTDANRAVGMRSVTAEFMQIVEKCKTLNDVFDASVKLRIFSSENALMFMWLLASAPDALAKIGVVMPPTISFDANRAFDGMRKSYDESYDDEIVEHFLEEEGSDDESSQEGSSKK